MGFCLGVRFDSLFNRGFGLGIKRKTYRGKTVFDFLVGFLPEVAQFEQFFRAFGDKLAYGGDTAAAQAVHRAHREVELLYRHVVLFIGDGKTDVDAGKSAGLKTVLVLSGKTTAEDIKDWELKPDHTFNDLPEAVEFIMREEKE